MDKQLLDVLACPVCKGQLHYAPTAKELICRLDRLAYPIRDGIPVLMMKEARALPPEEEGPAD
jgi:uncharacterized protein YbaR (Trm112 family)